MTPTVDTGNTRADVDLIANRVEVLALDRFRVGSLHVIMQKPGAQGTLQESEHYLYQELLRHIYRQIYAIGGVALPERMNCGRRESLRGALMNISVRPDSWSMGWRLRQLAGRNGALVQRGHISRVVRHGSYVTMNEDSGSRIGDAVSILSRARTIDASGSVVRFYGIELFPPFDELLAVRFYLHVCDEGAPGVAMVLPPLFDRYRIPFQLKVMTADEDADRADACTLYIDSAHFNIVKPLLVESLSEFEEHLVSATPLFTRRLSCGLALAEDPLDGNSFGLARCATIAAALCAAFKRGICDPAGRAASIEEAFRAQDVDVDRLFLRSKVSTDYAWP